jgi:quinol monooxygenase YgiN
MDWESDRIEVESRAMAKRKSKKSASGRSKGRGRSGVGRKAARSASRKLPKNAVTLIVQLRPRDGQDLLLEAELRGLVGPTRKEDGCLTYDLYRSAEGPSAYMLHEVWASREHHTSHTNTPHFLRWNARKDAVLASREATFWKQVG